MTRKPRITPLLPFLLVLASCGGKDSDRSGRTNEPENPDPPGAAPPGCKATLDQTTPTRFYDAVRCIYEGDGALQQGVEDGVIDPERATVLRGRVLNTEGQPIKEARIEVLGHEEFGYTQSRGDGFFDMVVNGGGRRTVRIEKEGFLRSQRGIKTQWRAFENYPDVVLVRPAKPAPPVNLRDLNVHRLIQGTNVSDQDGTRRHMVAVSPGQKVRIILEDGSEEELDSFSLRATEFTVGEAGPSAMPGDLPDTSAYTYALDLSAVEAEELGAGEIVFDPPLTNYVDNFLEFPAGTVVPVGVYNEKRDVWEAAESGIVIDILNVEDGVAAVDVDGDGEADDGSLLADLGIDEDELRLLGQEYEAGDSLWRVITSHFSAWDYNWPFGFPEDAIGATVGVLGFGPEDCRRTVQGSIIGCEDQTLGEVLPVTGTPHTLHYQSERTPGRRDRYSLDITLSGEEIPGSLKRIEVEVHVLGNVFKSTHEPEPEAHYLWTWDGRDAYERIWQGRQPVEVRVGYVYDGAYESTNRFGQVGTGTPITGDRAREEVTSWATWTGKVGGFNHVSLGFGGWTLGAHHVLDRRGQMLHLGTGRARSAEEIGPVIAPVAGTGEAGYMGDEGPALEAQFDRPHGLVIAEDGTVYVSDEGNHVVRRIHPNGTIDTYAGTGERGMTGDGGPAIEATFNEPLGITLGPDGTLYVGDRLSGRVRAISPDGMISTFAGGGEPDDGLGDGLAATDAVLREPHSIAMGPGGSLYIADSEAHRVRRVGPEGIISTVAGIGSAGGSGDDGPAVEAELDTPIGIAIDDDGVLYVSEFYGHRIRRIDPTGVITTLAGTGRAGDSGDGGPADEAQIDSPHDIQIGQDGSVYFSDEGNHRIRRVRRDGVIETIAGTGSTSPPSRLGGDGGSPLDATFSQPRVLYAHEDGSLWIGDYSEHRIRRIDPPLPGFSHGESMVASRDGSMIYVFDQHGRHQRTLNALTGFELWTFEYTDDGLLESLTDGFGNKTGIARDQSDVVLTGPYGHETALRTDDRGFLVRVTDPADARTELSYSDSGLLTSLRKPSGDTHVFQYDDDGLLLRDEAPSGYFQTFERKTLGDGFSVTRTHNGERPEIHEMRPGARRETRLLTDAAGITTTIERSPTYFSMSSPTQSTVTTFSGDPRFGTQAPNVSRSATTLSDELQLTVDKRRDIVLADAGNPLSVQTLTETTSVNGNAWTSVWSASDKTTVWTSPEGRTLSERRNDAGQLISREIGGISSSIIDYDDRGRPEMVTIGQRVLEFEYGADGFVSAVTNPLGERVDLRRDARGLIREQGFGDGSTIDVRHDQNGRLSGVTPPEQPLHGFGYQAGLLVAYNPPQEDNTASLRFFYDVYQALTLVEDGSGEELAFDYEDETGRLSTVTVGGEATNIAYDNVTGLVASVSSDDVTLALSYEGPLVSGQAWSGVVEGDVVVVLDEDLRVAEEVAGGRAIAFGYDRDGLMIQAGALGVVRDPKSGFVASTNLEDVDDTWGYNEYGEPSAYFVEFDGDVFYSRVDTRDALGRVKERTETIGGVLRELEFFYDVRGRLTSVEEAGDVIERYEYDANGNRTAAMVAGESVSAAYDDQDRLLAYGDATYEQTPAGDLVRKSERGEQTDFHYDRRGSLRQVDLPDGTGVEYVTDGFGRRIGKRVDGELVQGFLYRDLLSPVVELGPDGVTEVARFIYGTSPFVPDYMIKDGQTYRIITDQVGSVRLVVSATDGTIAQRIDYTAFGEVLNDTNAGFQPFGFAGGLYDVDTGLLRFGARDYDPVVGRWTAKDPILFAGGQSNLYGYAGNDPVNFFDPNGEWAHVAAGAAIGATVNTVGYLLMTDSSNVTALGLAGALTGGAVSGAGAAIGPVGAAIGGFAGTGLDGLISGTGASFTGALIGGFANFAGARLGADAIAKARLFPTNGLLVSQGVKDVGEDLLARAMGRSIGGELLMNILGRGATDACVQ